MELASLASNVSLANVGQTTAFTMEANQFSFRVLSDGLYQNKPGSMIRETACNALDSHIQSGKGDVPIRIHLPDTFEPYYSVQDFGLGLDDNGVRSTFATYFKSTKREDNTATGAFGLGSKTPFAYTDAFTITAIKDGKKRLYAAFINEDGLPAITNMGGECEGVYLNDDGVSIADQWTPTDEGNGVTIMVPVTTSNDFYRFRTETQNQLAFFPVKPEIINCDSIKWMDWQTGGEYMDLGNVFIGDRYNNRAFSGLWIVQGPVGYKADVALLKQHVSHDNREFIDIIGECGLLKFELGQIEVTPSREGVQYSKRTIAAVEALLDSARVTLSARIQAQVDALGDSWNKAKTINEDNLLRRLANITKAKFEADGYYKSGAFYYLDLEKIANLEGLKDDKAVSGPVALGFDAKWDDSEPGDEDETDEPEQETEAGAVVLADLLNLQFRQYVYENVYYSRRAKKWREGNVGRHAKADSSFIVVVRDTTEKPVVRIREFLSEQAHNSQVYVLQNRNGGPVTADELEAIKARVGASWKPALLSKVELPLREQAGFRSGYKAPTAYTFGNGDDMCDTTDWERETEKLKEFDGAYYVTVFRNRTNASRQDAIVFKMAEAGLLDKPIMAIREKDVEKLAGNPNWVPVRVKADEIVESVKGNKSLANARNVAGIRNEISIGCLDSGVAKLLAEACAKGEIPASSPLHRVFKVANVVKKLKARAVYRGYNSITSMALAWAGVPDKSSEVNQALYQKAKTLAEPVAAAYPLLTFLHSHHSNGYQCPTTQAAHILAYVKAVSGE